MSHINRRQWLQTSFLASSALLLGGPTSALTNRFTEQNSVKELDELIRLNYNENPWGPSAKARNAIIESIEQANRYPDELVEALKKKIAVTNQVDPRQILITAGSTEILSLLGQQVGHEKGEIITAWPTFPTLLSAGEDAGASVKKVPVKQNNQLNLDQMKEEISNNTRLIFVCNPNNPTSTEVETSELKAFCRVVPSNVIVCIDEAYIEYSKNGMKGSMMQLLNELPNIIIVRTFSKVYGLAGLRIGYAVSSQGIISQLQLKHPGREIAAGVAPLAAANATMDDTEFLQKCITKNQEGREIVYEAYNKWGVSYVKSSTSFIYTSHEHFDKNVISKMKNDGILITKWNIMKDYIRISIGKPKEMETFVKVIKKYLI